MKCKYATKIHYCLLIIADRSENERIRHRIVDMYADFVRDVDPKGRVMDLLITERIVSQERAADFEAQHTSRQSRCRALLNELFSHRNPRSFLVLREALGEHYDWIVKEIDKTEPPPRIPSTPDARRLDQLEGEKEQC
jgi:hypothetical protein